MTTLDELIGEIREKERICPNPQPWNRLWFMLPDRRRVGQVHERSAPLILAAWHHTSDAEKRERFLTHLQWANDHGALEKISDFLAGLSSEDWHDEEKKT